MTIFNFLIPKAKVVYVTTNHTVRQTLERMQAHGYTAIPLLNDDGTYAGTITEGDLLWFFKENTNLDIKKAEEYLITKVMRSRNNEAVNVSADIDMLMDLSLRQNFTPVLDDRHMFIGIVTRRDILTFYQQHASISDNEETFFNPTINKIMSRRSIRKYTNEAVTYEDIETIVDAGLAAPTAVNRKPVHILILQEQDKRNELYNRHRRGKLISEAAVAIAVYGDTTVEESDFLLNNDCSAAIQNMLIAIEALGLGGVWIGCKDEEWRNLVSDVYEVPNEYKLYGMIAFGHPNEVKEAHKNADPKKVHLNKW